MTNNLVQFSVKGTQGQQHQVVRAIMQDDEPWWFLADVCKVLEIGNPSQAAACLDDDEKMTLHSMKGNRGNLHFSGLGASPTLIDASGVYSLVLKSRKQMDDEGEVVITDTLGGSLQVFVR